jgi:Raf kinase inhibitor-like YbhB/YbcL family protein
VKSFFFFLILLILIGSGIYWYYLSGPYSNGLQRTFFGKQESMTLTSKSFKNGQKIPSKYTCDGEDVNPSLEFHAIPVNTKSLAIIVEDKDSKPQNFTHWIIFNILPTLNGIDENTVPDGAVQGINDFSNTFYNGPCPTEGEHRYVFKLYALDKRLNLEKGTTKSNIQKEMKNHILDEAELVGVYQKISQ